MQRGAGGGGVGRLGKGRCEMGRCWRYAGASKSEAVEEERVKRPLAAKNFEAVFEWWNQIIGRVF